MSEHIVGWNTFYVTSDESSYSGPATSELVDRAGNVIARVPHAFAQDLFIEGAGRLRDGRIVNVAGRTCGTEHFEVAGYTGEPCYSVLSGSKWGHGVQGYELKPLETIAVDERVIPYGSWVYIPQWDGKFIPRVSTPVGAIGNFTHNGWFFAGDTGGFKNREGSYGHIDIFAGTRGMYAELERIWPTHSRMDLYVGGHPGMSVGRALLTIAVVGALGAVAYAYIERPKWLEKKTKRWLPKIG